MKLPLLVLTAVLLSGCSGGEDSANSTPGGTASVSPSPGGTPSPTVSPTATPTPVTTVVPAAPVLVGAAAGTDTGTGLLATAVLARVAVKGRGPKTGYSREAFGQAWADINRNGCDTRNDVLKRDLTAPVFKAGTRDCKVNGGTLGDPYTAKTLAFIVGGVSEVDIDHVVALGNAWVSGAARLTPDGRAALANDPLNLLAVDASANRQKGDGDAATWLPSSRGYRCAYVARQTAVKAKYKLSMTASEKTAIGRVLASCPQQLVPAGGSATVAAGFGAVAPTTRATPRPVVTTRPPTATARPVAPPEPSGTDYGTCKAAIAADGGNYVQGVDPEYAFYRDTDSDGVVCES